MQVMQDGKTDFSGIRDSRVPVLALTVGTNERKQAMRNARLNKKRKAENLAFIWRLRRQFPAAKKIKVEFFENALIHLKRKQFIQICEQYGQISGGLLRRKINERLGESE